MARIRRITCWFSFIAGETGLPSKLKNGETGFSSWLKNWRNWLPSKLKNGETGFSSWLKNWRNWFTFLAGELDKPIFLACWRIGEIVLLSKDGELQNVVSFLAGETGELEKLGSFWSQIRKDLGTTCRRNQPIRETSDVTFRDLTL